MIPAASGFRTSAGVTEGEGWPIHGQGDGASSRSSRGPWPQGSRPDHNRHPDPQPGVAPFAVRPTGSSADGRAGETC